MPALLVHVNKHSSTGIEVVGIERLFVWQELTRQADIEERDRRTHALVKAEIGVQRRATAVGWGLARNKAAQNASTSRMAQLTEDFAAVQAATGKLSALHFRILLE